jgi:DNA helicase II / ATP-dependent DNA helicase PcrA
MPTGFAAGTSPGGRRPPSRNLTEGLNPPQAEAVRTLAGPLLVLAGAGTGKTRVVTYRIANLIRHGTPPDRILAVTFTNKASGEMQERITQLIGPAKRRGKGKAPPKPTICTFHAHCVRILRRHAKAIGFSEKFTICDRADQESIARSVLRDLRLPGTAIKPSDMLAIIGGWKNASVKPDRAAAVAATDKEHFAAAGYRRYQDALRARGAMDFDDLLLHTEQLLEENSEIRELESGRFDHVLVDEYQDTNGSQYRITRHLGSPTSQPLRRR